MKVRVSAFDGDEMNAHLPQSSEAIVELEDIAAVPWQIVRPRDAKPIIDIVQDTLVGSYLATKPNNSFNRREFMNLMMWNKRFSQLPAAMQDPETNKTYYNGAQIISSLLPPVNISTKTKLGPLEIEEGILKKGLLSKPAFNQPGSGIVHTTFNDYGPMEAVKLIDSLQTVLESYLIMKGFSVGVSDLIADEKTRKDMEEVIKQKKQQIEQIILQVHMDLFTNNTGKTNQEEFESRIFAILNKAVDEAGKLGENSLAEENRLICMIRAGSKGSTVNIAQMIACVGQQNVEGKRTPYGFTDRTLPHYKKYDDGAESRGFVESSFVRGLNPQEFFFHAMSGREGLIDTAVKTSETGYTQRRLVKAMEDLMVQHDGTVRDANNNIVQFYYGEDGLNSTKIEMTELKLQDKSDGDLAKMYGLEGIDLTSILQPNVQRDSDSQLLADFVEQGKEDRTMIVERVFHGARTGDIFGPLNLDRIIFNLKIKFRLNNQTPTDLTPRMILEGIQQIIDRTYPFNKTWCALLRYHLCPYNILVEKRFTKEAWDTLVNMVITKVWKAGSVPGELVGIIAAQSIGEPTTQMSCVGSTKITVHGKDFSYDGPIDKFIDSMIEQHKERVLSLGNDSLVYDPEDNYYIAGVSQDEKSSWNRILQVSRHPANGKLVEVKTRSGRITTATLSHSFLKRSEKGIESVKGSDLVIGDRIPVAKYIPIVPNPIQQKEIGNQVVQCDYEFGWVCGLYLNDGLIKDDSIVFSHYEPYMEERLQAFAKAYNYPLRVNVIESEFGTVKNFVMHSSALQEYFIQHFGSELYRKEMSGEIFHMNYEFLRGVLSGCFDSAGNIHGDRQLIRFTMTSKVLSQQIAKLCSYFGFFGSFGEEVNVEKRQYVYMILRKYAKEILDVIRIHDAERAKGLQLIVDYNNRDNVHSNMELIDKLPYCGRLIAETATILHMPSCSRIYRRWLKKESVGRETLRKYIRRFNHALETNKGITHEDRATVTENVKLLQQATESDVVWDEITELNLQDDPKTYVYDFTVPGNDSFMVDDNVYVHNTLNTFHLAGVAAKSNMTRGVPRLKELLQVTHNPKAISLTVYLKPEFRENKDRVREVIQDLEITLLKDITLKAGIYYDPKDEETIVEDDRELIQFFRAFEALETKDEDDDSKWNKWMLRLEFDREKMFNRNITMDDVHYVLKERFADDIQMVYSDYNSTKLIMRIRIVDSDPLLNDDLNSLKKFQNRILNNIVIRGVPGIRAVTFRKSKDMHVLKDGKYEQIEQYVLDTDGSNFLEVMNHPSVDGNHIYSTNVHDIYEQLGIEAARQVLYSEMAGLFEEAGINYRHLCLLVDVMTHPGRLISVDRYGINKNDNGPLAKACFEETDKILRKAAQFGEIDPVTGVSANVMTGQTIRGGTAFSQILLDEEALPALLANEPLIEHYDEPDDRLTERNIQAVFTEEENDMCSQTRLSMNINLPVGTGNMEDEDEIEIITV